MLKYTQSNGAFSFQNRTIKQTEYWICYWKQICTYILLVLFEISNQLSFFGRAIFFFSQLKEHLLHEKQFMQMRWQN